MIQNISRRFTQWMKDELQSKRLLPGLTSGVLMGIVEIMVALSLGNLIFSGELVVYLPYGIGMALITAAVMMIATSLTSSVPGVMGSTQDTSTVILAVIAAGLVATLSSAGAETILTTIMAAIALSALLTGVFFLALGFFKMGKLVRFVPYPVVGGFLAGTGWLLVQGSFGVMADYSLNLSNVPGLFHSDQLILWLPGVMFAFVLFFSLRRIHHFLAMPGILLGSVIVFYLGLLVTGTSI